MLVRSLSFAAFFLCAACASTRAPEPPPGYVLHEAPKEPKFLEVGFYEVIKAKLPPPPPANSLRQKSDEAKLLEAQNSRSPADCERANAEVRLSLSSFFGGEGGLLNPAEVSRLEPFLGQVRNDIDFFIQRLKNDFPRPRPFLYVDGVKPCVPKEVTQAYPSGHAAIARLQALVLGRIFPERSGAFYRRAKEIGQDRVLAGVHHPSDVAAGAQLAEEIYTELGKSGKFREALGRAARP
jgi:acid phosphatase (class A)